jgi:hypothetical protein
MRSGVRLAHDLIRLNRCRDCGGVGHEYGSLQIMTPVVLANPQVVASLKLLRRSGLVYPWERGTENRY